MAKKSYDERSVITSLKKIAGVNISYQGSHLVVEINPGTNLGIHQLGKLDYLRKYCNATIIRLKEASKKKEKVIEEDNTNLFKNITNQINTKVKYMHQMLR